MSAPALLQVIRDGAAAHALPLGVVPVYVGRSPDNDLVLTDETVSSRHAAVWVEAGRAWIRDQGSRNGTFLNDKRIKGATTIGDDAVIRLGLHTILRIQWSNRSAQSTAPKALVVEDIAAGVRTPVRSDRFYIGSGPNADMVVEAASDIEAALTIHANGEIWIGTNDDEGPLDIDTEFVVSGRRLRLVQVDPAYTPTVEVEPDRYPYRLRVTLDGASGPQASIEDIRDHRVYTVNAENRAVLLYLLARQFEAARSKTDTSQGWCSDEEIAKGIWGRRGVPDGNSLHVLVHRLRKELKRANFDPWFIEKRRRAIRIRVREVVLS